VLCLVKISNSKHEIPACGRQAKFETNTNFQNANNPNRNESFRNWRIRVLDLFRISIFGFRN